MADFNPTHEPLGTLFRFWLRLVVWGLRITPLCFVLLLPVVVAIDRFSPWPVAIHALSAYPGQTRLCVGLGGQGYYSRTAPDHRSVIQRSFILWPRVFTTPAVVTVTSTNDRLPIVEESSFGFWFITVIYLIVLVIFTFQLRAFIATRHAQSTET